MERRGSRVERMGEEQGGKKGWRRVAKREKQGRKKGWGVLGREKQDGKEGWKGRMEEGGLLVGSRVERREGEAG